MDWDIAIDMGTANTRLYSAGRGLVADRPSALEPDPMQRSNESAPPAGPGRSAPKTGAVPLPLLRAGIIEDCEAAVAMLSPLIRLARPRRPFRCRVLACAPSDVTPREGTILVDVIRWAGATAVSVVPAPLAASLGAGNDIASPYAHLLVDIGEGVTDIAVIRSGSVIASGAVRSGFAGLQASLSRLVLEKLGFILRRHDAETLIRTVGCAPGTNLNKSWFCPVYLPDSGDAIIHCFDSSLVNEAIHPPIREMVSGINRLLRSLSDSTACEVIESGLSLTGGGACLHGMAAFIAAETALDVKTAENPLHAVIEGAGRML